MIRRIIAEFREFPASTTLGVAWVAVFLLMLANYLQNTPSPSITRIIIGNFTPAHRYGDLTPNELFQGEAWRTITCTFVHYNLLHIGLNLYGLYQLGGLVEQWYGSWLFVAIYGLIGGGGNIISALFRRALGLNLMMHSGGGSTVVLGLVALAAVVGWRMKTRNGDYLRSQMVGILVFTAILGVLLPIIDNWGHAGGAIMGASIGLGHRHLLRFMKGLVAPVAGILAGFVLVSSGVAQVRENKAEDRVHARLAQTQRRVDSTGQICRNLASIEFFYRRVLQAKAQAGLSELSDALSNTRPGPWRRNTREPWPLLSISAPNFSAELPMYLALFDSTRAELGTPPTATDYQRVRDLLAHLFDRPTTIETWREFRSRWTVLLKRAVQEHLQARTSIELLARNPRLR